MGAPGGAGGAGGAGSFLASALPVTQSFHGMDQLPPWATVTVGPPVHLGLTDAVADTAALMSAVVDLLPDEARQVHVPTDEELAATRPSA